MLTRHADWRSGRRSSAPIPNPSGRSPIACDSVGAIRSRRLCARGLLLALLGSLLFCPPCSGAASQTDQKNVLILFSSIETDSHFVDLIEKTVRTRVPGRTNFYISHIQNFTTDEDEETQYLRSQAETFQVQFAQTKPDVVVTLSPMAILFTVQYRDKMFPGVPVVFTEIGTREFGTRQWPPGVTGVTVPIGIGETIDLALRLHPDTTTVALIGGLDWYWTGAVHSELLRYQSKVKEVDFKEPASRALLAKVLALPPHTVVLFHIPFGSDRPDFGGLDLLTAVSKRFPVYSAWRGNCIDHGCIGGAYGDDTPKVETAEIVARVLSGARADEIPVLHDRHLQDTVDWRELQRWHIPKSALPPGSLVLYRQPTLWERDRNYILAAIAVIIIQALAIAGLLWQRARKRKAEAVLRESEERFRVMADTTPALIWMCDAQGKITYLNERWLAFTGPGSGTGYGDTWIAYIHPGDVKSVLDELWSALKEQRSFSKEYRLHRNDGTYRWMFDVASPRLNGDGSFAGFIGSAIDVTDQKMAQQALETVSGQLIEAQEKERTRIARDLHDDICQRLALLSMELEQAKSVAKGRVQATRDLEQIRMHCSEIAGDVQSLSHQLHSSKLDYLGVVAAIRGFSKEFSMQHGVKVDFTEKDAPRHLPKDASLCLFRVAQEALHNAVKYSGVAEFKVELSAASGEVQLVVADAGVGFDIEASKENRGLGLVSMQERVHLVHGKFSIQSQPGMGTRIVAIVPLVSQNAGGIADADAREGAGTLGMAS